MRPSFAAILFAACSLPLGLHAQETCPEWGRFERVASLESQEIDESSGLASSRSNPGSLWTHNDSGDSARLFLLDEDASDRAVVQLDGVDARDWEDMAIGPCADGATPCVYVADIGDNLAMLDEVKIHRFPEPELGETTTSFTARSIETLTFRYPDGARDAEALLVHPTGRIFVADKVDGGTVQIYEVPAQFGQTVDATVIATLELTETNEYANLITAGDFSPDGRQAILKTYFFLYTFCGDSDDPVATLRTTPNKQNAPLTLQGESLAWDAQRDRIWITSERLPAPLFYMDRLGSSAEDAGQGTPDSGPSAPPDASRADTDATQTGDAEASPEPDTRAGSEKEGCSAAGGQPTSLLFGAFLLLSFAIRQKRSTD